MAKSSTTLDEAPLMLGFQPSLAPSEADLKRDDRHSMPRRSLQCLVALYHLDDEKL